MSTKKIRELIGTAEGAPGRLFEEALADVETIEKAARALVSWNNRGQPRLDLDAARAYDVLEVIAKESGK